MRLVHVAAAVVVTGAVAGGVLLLQGPKNPRRLIAEYEQYRSAVALFEARYDALPGDFTGATTLWGAAGGNGSDDACYAVDSRFLDDPKRTCDGNGNHALFYEDGSPNQGTAPEWFRSWQHLANAGLVKGHFSGHAIGHPRGAVPQMNVPASAAYDNAGFTLMSFNKLDHPKWFAGHYFGLAFGRPFTNPIGLRVETRGPAMPVADAVWLDTKMDDAAPDSGLVRSFRDLEDCIEPKGARYRYRGDEGEVACGLFMAFSDPSHIAASQK